LAFCVWLAGWLVASCLLCWLACPSWCMALILVLLFPLPAIVLLALVDTGSRVLCQLLLVGNWLVPHLKQSLAGDPDFVPAVIDCGLMPW
jgi:hypothetical protein